MREIKFRAWHKDMKYMTPIGSLCLGKWAEIYIPEQVPPEGEVEWGGGEVGLDKLEIMQFTGLYDKYKKPIFEGDIVKGPTYSTCTGKGYKSTRVKEIVFKVESYMGYFGYSFTINGDYDNNYRGLPNPKDVEIIGNVYENPEMLKGEK